MVSDKLVPYWVRLRDKKKRGIKRKESEYFDLTSFEEQNSGFENDTFHHFLVERLDELLEDGYEHESWDKTLTVRQYGTAEPGAPLSTNSGYTIEAELGYGKYGRASDHLPVDEIEDGSTSPHEVREENARDRDTSAEDRYYFLFHIPGSSPSRGLTVFHKIGNGSPKTSLYKYLKDHLTNSYEVPSDDNVKGLSFYMNTIASKDLIDQLVEDDIMVFELVKRKINSESFAQGSEYMGNSKDTKVTVSIETDEIRLDRDTINDLISKVQDNETPFVEIFDEGSGLQEDIDKVNARVKTTGDRTRKRDLSRDKLTLEEYINTRVDYDEETNRPSMPSIGRVAREFINEQLRVYDNETLDEEQSLLRDVSNT
jgi:uncharacterized protein YdcH (DUF465 family)